MPSGSPLSKAPSLHCLSGVHVRFAESHAGAVGYVPLSPRLPKGLRTVGTRAGFQSSLGPAALLLGVVSFQRQYSISKQESSSKVILVLTSVHS